LDHRAEAVAYAQEFGRGMNTALTDKFVGMYVNPLTLDMGRPGREAIARMLTRAYHAAMIPRPVHLEFVE
jgi:1,4-dihydroxy-6-naphthoate synthase